jgi:hypothetical protein
LLACFAGLVCPFVCGGLLPSVVAVALCCSGWGFGGFGCLVGFGAGCGSTTGSDGETGLGAASGCGTTTTFGLGGGMSLSTRGLMPGSVRTSGSIEGFGSDVATFADATPIGRSRETPTATTVAKPRATTIAHVPTFRRGSRSRSRVRSRSRTSEPRYPPRRGIAAAGTHPGMTSAKVRMPALSVGALPTGARSMSTKISTHPLSQCYGDDRRCHARKTPGPRDACCIIYRPGFSFYVTGGET